MKAGFIGTGSMGSILIEGLLKSEALRSTDITVINRTRSKAERLVQKYEGIRIANGITEIPQYSETIFICVKPMEYPQVIESLRNVVKPNHIVVSITSPVQIRLLEEQLPCKIAKVIPSITNYMQSGTTLCMYSDRMEEEDIEQLEDLLSTISLPKRIHEQFTRVTSDLSSCGPAFVAFFVSQLVNAAVEETGISRAEANCLVSEMVLGTGKLLTSGEFTPESLQARVSVPGGITAEAIHLMQTKFDDVFHALIHTTHAKYKDDLEKIETAFYGTQVD